MLIETMSPTEVFNEIQKDLPGVENSIDRLKEEYHKLRRKNGVGKYQDYLKTYKIKTKRKNPWVIIFSKYFEREKYVSTKDIYTIIYTYHYRRRGLRVYKINASSGLSIYTGHLFARFNERMDLGLVDPLDIVRTFFNDNQMLIGELKKDKRVEVTCTDGLLLGKRVKEGWTVYNTFIGFNEIREVQDKNRRERIDTILAEVDKRNYNQNPILFRDRAMINRVNNLFIEI